MKNNRTYLEEDVLAVWDENIHRPSQLIGDLKRVHKYRH